MKKHSISSSSATKGLIVAKCWQGWSEWIINTSARASFLRCALEMPDRKLAVKSQPAKQPKAPKATQGTQGTQGAQGAQGTQGTQATQGASSWSPLYRLCSEQSTESDKYTGYIFVCGIVCQMWMCCFVCWRSLTAWIFQDFPSDCYLWQRTNNAQ